MPKLMSPLKVITSGTRFLTKRVRRSVWALAELLMLTLMVGFCFSKSATMDLNWSAASDLNWKKSSVTVPAVLEPQPARPNPTAIAHITAAVRTARRFSLGVACGESDSIIVDSFIFLFLRLRCRRFFHFPR